MQLLRWTVARAVQAVQYQFWRLDCVRCLIVLSVLFSNVFVLYCGGHYGSDSGLS